MQGGVNIDKLCVQKGTYGMDKMCVKDKILKFFFLKSVNIDWLSPGKGVARNIITQDQ